MYSYLSTSRGAGNFGLSKKRCIFLISYSYLSTSRGAGNVTSPRKSSNASLDGIDPYLPREGTETLIADFLSLASFYRYLSTSRGAGNFKNLSPDTVCQKLVYLPIYLARGRKRFVPFSFINKSEFRISTNLPREGPETRQKMLILNHNQDSIDTYLPREGPETQSQYLSNQIPSQIRIYTYLPREGPETFRDEVSCKLF